MIYDSGWVTPRHFLVSCCLPRILLAGSVGVDLLAGSVCVIDLLVGFVWVVVLVTETFNGSFYWTRQAVGPGHIGLELSYTFIAAKIITHRKLPHTYIVLLV